MFEGIGLQTLGGILAVVTAGQVTPASCYVSLGGTLIESGVELEQPIGSLGCQYDMDRLRIFLEHQSSPASSTDNPGFNHAGVKYLVPADVFMIYAGLSVDFGSQFSRMDNPLAVVGVETQTNPSLFVEHIQSTTGDFRGHTVGGVKVLF